MDCGCQQESPLAKEPRDLKATVAVTEPDDHRPYLPLPQTVEALAPTQHLVSGEFRACTLRFHVVDHANDLVGVHQPDDLSNDKGMAARSPDDKSLFHMFSIYVAGTLTGYRQDTTDTSTAGAPFHCAV
jgi:hypothetical protein